MADEAGRSLGVPNVPTTLTVAITAGSTWAGKGQVVEIRAVNKGSAKCWFSVAHVRGGVTTYLYNQYDVEAHRLFAETMHQILEVGDVLSVQAQTAGTMDIMFSGYEGVS